MAGPDVETAKRRVVAEVDRRAPLLHDTARRIHERPEVLFEERFACELLSSCLEEAGFAVERGVAGLQTAFRARTGSGDGATVAVLCEYDALPGIGHACGHNLIAAAGLGAGVAAASVADDVGGSLVVIGTPAEEGGGGKVFLIDGGVFDDVDAAMMVHPGNVDLTEPRAMAIATWEVEYHGRAAHAAAHPEDGRNALDAAVLGYNAVAALRQHLAATDRVHGVFLKAGDKPNIVPDHTVAEWYVRSANLTSLQTVKERVMACLEAGAAAAGCGFSWRSTAPEYSDLRSNPTLLALYRENSTAIGRPLAEPVPGHELLFSTDMGNVSYRVPAIHPIVRVSPHDVSIHSPLFTEWAASAEGDRAVVDGAKAMAMTAVDLWLRPDAVAEIRAGSPPAS